MVHWKAIDSHGMKRIQTALIGRFGNQLFQYAYARSVCERYGVELGVPKWVGEEIFDLGVENSAKTDDSLPRCEQLSECLADGDFQINGYAQSSGCVSSYSKKDVERWFRFKPTVLDQLETLVPIHRVVAHRRVGDYPGSGYPVVSKKSYENAVAWWRLGELEWVTEENPAYAGFPNHLGFLPDFWRMTKAVHLLRGNSSFSWWAASLCAGDVYSPRIDGLVGGIEHDCEFVRGNWPRIADIHGVDELRLKED